MVLSLVQGPLAGQAHGGALIGLVGLLLVVHRALSQNRHRAEILRAGHGVEIT